MTLASVFYPTAYPEAKHPKVGLVESQEQVLAKAADTFKSNEQYDRENQKLMVVAHADVRGSEKYNQALSERRAETVKEYLVSQGIAVDKIGNLEPKERTSNWPRKRWRSCSRKIPRSPLHG